ncbi:MAG: CPBP family intramembrane metalloprotease, partial [Spirochaetia bacterium]|nr:CPBP family intramembrane metalloprotease [Spirochaetia bacterium]
TMLATLLSMPILVLLFMQLGGAYFFSYLVARSPEINQFVGDQLRFWTQVYMTLCTFLFFFFCPWLMAIFLPVKMDRPLGLGLRGAGRHFLISLTVIAIMIPVLWVSFSGAALNNFYPVYKPGSLSDWALYECIYLPLFIPTEFFFRGVLLYRLEKYFPGRGVWIAIIPYAIGHVFKPIPEALGSVIAGYVLGTLSLQCRSIWPGFVIHAGIAFLADLFALIESGYINRLLN